jgi:hypothetical protein
MNIKIRKNWNHALLKSSVYEWLITFKSSHTSTTNNASSGCPSRSSTDENTAWVHFTTLNRQVITVKVTHHLYVSHITVHEIILNRLGFNKVCVTWVPNNSQKRTKATNGNLLKPVVSLLSQSQGFLTCTVTRKETWIHHMSQRESTRVWTVNIWHHQSKRSSKQTHQQGKWWWHFSGTYKDKSWNTIKGGVQH